MSTVVASNWTDRSVADSRSPMPLGSSSWSSLSPAMRRALRSSLKDSAKVLVFSILSAMKLLLSVVEAATAPSLRATLTRSTRQSVWASP